MKDLIKDPREQRKKKAEAEQDKEKSKDDLRNLARSKGLNPNF